MRDKYGVRKQQEYERYHNTPGPLASVYLIMITPPGQALYHKIGHTSIGLVERFRRDLEMPSYVRLYESDYMDLDKAKLLEKTIHDAFSSKRFVPTHRFGGRFECFRLDKSDISLIGEWLKKA